MLTRNLGTRFAALSLAALGLAALPSSVMAQESGIPGAETAATDLLNRPIDLDVKSANLFYALTLLFDQIKVANYTLPDALKRYEVSAHFTKLPIRTALETLLRNSGYTYKVDGGVYSVVPKLEEPEPQPLPPDPTTNAPLQKGKKVYRLGGGNIIYNAVDIVTRLGGRVLPGAVGSQAGSTGASALGGGIGNALGGIGGSLGGGLGGFGGGYGNSLGGGIGGFGNGGFGNGANRPGTGNSGTTPRGGNVGDIQGGLGIGRSGGF
jgi:hypothetical protein